LSREVEGDEKERVALVEAALYASEKPLSARKLAAALKIRSVKEVEKLIATLKKRYLESGSAIEIFRLRDGRYSMRLRPEYLTRVRKLCKRRILSLGPLKTLSFIAYRQPVTKAYVAKVRGKHAYAHVKLLKEMGFIHEESENGRKLLRTTDVFADTFNLDRNVEAMKRQLTRVFASFKGVKSGES